MSVSQNLEQVPSPVVHPRTLNARVLATTRLLLIVFAVGQGILTGCTPIEPFRTHSETPAIFSSADDAQPNSDNILATPAQRSIEQHPNYLLGFVEFDDQGWFYDREAKQMKSFLSKLKDVSEGPDGILLFVFVHGWKHNASTSDQNVKEFRAILEHTFENQRQASDGKRRKVVGLYVGWRGLSMWPSGVIELTIFDRKNTADHIAKGSVRELFARLAHFATEKNMGHARSDRPVRTLIIGHSLGALVVFNATSPNLLASAVANEPSEGTTDRPMDLAFPDLTVLVNPAFEASRYAPLHRLTNRSFSESQRPLFVLLTAENDWATHHVFRLARWVSTRLEGYPHDSENLEEEEQANHNTVGWVDKYRTHYLFPGDPNSATARAFLDRNSTSSTAKCSQPATDKPYGDVTLRHAPQQDNCDRNSPFWVVRVDKEIIDSHNGFFFDGTFTKKTPNTNPKLIDFVLDILNSANP